MISLFYFVKREFRKLSFVIRDLKVLRDPICDFTTQLYVSSLNVNRGLSIVPCNMEP